MRKMNWEIWKSMRIDAIAHLNDKDIGEVKLLITNTGGIYDIVMVGMSRALRRAKGNLDLTSATFIKQSIFFGYPALIIHSTGDWDMAIKIFTDIATSFDEIDIDVRLAAHEMEGEICK